MVARLAVDNGPGAGGVVADHAAEVGTAGGRHIRPELQSMGDKGSVQLVQDHTRPDPHHAAFDVQVCDFTVIARKINDETITDRASHQTGAGAPRKMNPR